MEGRELISIIEYQVDLSGRLNTIDFVLRAQGVGRPEMEVHVVKDIPGEQNIVKQGKYF